jgi:uncharacterized protein (DUF305 family)
VVTLLTAARASAYLLLGDRQLASVGTMKRILAGMVMAAIAIAGCGSSDEAAHNESDIAFATQMIPHHEQAVEMSQLAQDAQASPEVLDLAGRIEAAQGPEIDQMKSWLADWDAPYESSAMAEHGDHSDHGMEGMLSADQMDGLAQAEGDEFDRMFLEGMIEHHEGAVDMAEAQLESGESEKATELAEAIISSQQAEIDEMRALLDA